MWSLWSGEESSCLISINFKSKSSLIHDHTFWCLGLSKVTTLGGSHWFVTFIDNCTRMTWVCLMKTKGEVSSLFQKFHKIICTCYKAQVQVLRSDNGGEYRSSELQQHLEEHGAIHQTTCSNTQQQNGLAKWKNRHLLEVVHASFIKAHMSLSYWVEALAFAVYLINWYLLAPSTFGHHFKLLLKQLLLRLSQTYLITSLAV